MTQLSSFLADTKRTLYPTTEILLFLLLFYSQQQGNGLSLDAQQQIKGFKKNVIQT